MSFGSPIFVSKEVRTWICCERWKLYFDIDYNVCYFLVEIKGIPGQFIVTGQY